MKRTLPLNRHLTVKGAGVFLALVLLAGCTSLQELRDPWVVSEKADFSKQGAITGQLTVHGYNEGGWNVYSHLRNVDNDKVEYLLNSPQVFFRKVNPGKYRINIEKLYQFIYGAYATYSKEVWLKYRSQIFDVKAGEVVYVGDIHIYLGQPENLKSNENIAWLDKVLPLAEKQLKIGHNVKDMSYEKLETLKQRHPENDYKFRIQIAELTSLN